MYMYPYIVYVCMYAILEYVHLPQDLKSAGLKSRRGSSSINRFLTENASLWMELDCGHFHRKYVFMNVLSVYVLYVSNNVHF